MKNSKGALSPAKEIAYVAVSCALVICAQLALSAVPGVEVVTAFFVCLSFSFGARFGFFLGASFSILRCIIFGVYPSVLILYAIYFPLLGTLFGFVGKIKRETWERYPLYFAVLVCASLLIICCASATCAALNLIKISRLYATAINVLLWIICGLSGGALIAFLTLYILKRCGICRLEGALKLLTVTVLAAVCTVCFTLLDDVITPLVIGMTAEGALAYFYSSFIAMLPQTVCTIITVSLTFYPLTASLRRIS
ncbi:MAG: hypothetical protein ACI4MH_04140 [Candidatus Coproplasma sp.]